MHSRYQKRWINTFSPQLAGISVGDPILAAIYIFKKSFFLLNSDS